MKLDINSIIELQKNLQMAYYSLAKAKHEVEFLQQDLNNLNESYESLLEHLRQFIGTMEVRDVRGI